MDAASVYVCASELSSSLVILVVKLMDILWGGGGGREICRGKECPFTGIINVCGEGGVEKFAAVGSAPSVA